MKNVMPSRSLKYTLLPVFVMIFMQVGRPLPLWRYLAKRDFYFDFIFGLIIGGLLWNYIQFAYSLLNNKMPWSRGQAKRAVAQIVASLVAPVFLFLALYLGYMELYYGNNFSINKSIIFEVDLIVATMIIILMNMIFVVVDLLEKSHLKTVELAKEINEEKVMQAELIVDKEPSKILIANGSRYVLLDRSQIQLIKLQNGVPVAYMKDGGNSIMNTPLTALSESLPDYFFQINRNTIVNLREVKGFVAEKSGKLILRLDLQHEEDIVVSQNRSVEFKDRLVTA